MVIKFWRLLAFHAFSLFDFNKYIYVKYDILHIFNTFILFITNFDRLGLKTFSNQLPYDLFKLFFGLF